MGFSLPEPLTLSQMQKLAFCCGLSKTGPKSALRQRIVDSVADSRPLQPTARILSIDMGIRNLAFSLLSPLAGPGVESTPIKRGHSSAASKAAQSTLPSLKTQAFAALHAWHRQDLLSVLDPTSTEPNDPDDAAEATTAALLSDFSPASLSSVAVRLVRDQLLSLNPTHILIERQRYRSGGRASVLEWTLRVNSLESMLYAALATLRDLGHWGGAVVPVEPSRATPFLLEQAAGWLLAWEPAVRDPKTKAGRKRLKVEMLGELLRAGDAVHLANARVYDTARAFLALSSRGGERAKKKGDANAPAIQLGKLDDLADSLLQGLVYMTWEANKTMLREKGVEGFLD
ncbi:hypothetical protein NKR23_g8351 [Pleurostoma richardsiae]|uniref:Mitochondrial resolvase Ydc2 catalytic domain-containing protein n=1 Tax=Pleurostoma richardsiae TaxID=41990 RepID=A0AA38VFT3_9PEZI|nr:hypothetical protein NKR23_g8351 [Pleurostoma richardsiae]